MEKRYLENIAHLKNIIEAERKTIRQIKASKTNFFQAKGELEEFFLDCIE